MSSYELPESCRRHTDVLVLEVTPKPGDVVSRLRKGTDRIGRVVTQVVTTQAAMDIARRFRDAFQILITDHSKKSTNG